MSFEEEGFVADTTAVIELGSTGIRLLIARTNGENSVEVLDRASKPSRIGRDVFTLGHVTREAMRETVAIFISYRELLAGYGIPPERARVFATSALREATNRDTFVDRIALQTGFQVTVVEDIEENHLMYLAIQHTLQDERDILAMSNTMILEVGGGSTEIMLLKRGNMVASHSLRIGTVRVAEHIRSLGTAPSYIGRIVEDSVRTACNCLEEEMPLDGVTTFIVIGSDARLAAMRNSGLRTGKYCILSREVFCKFAEDVATFGPEELVAKHKISWADAEGLATGLAIEKLFLSRTIATEVIIPDVSIREGLLLSVLQGSHDELAEEMRRQILASAAALGQKFHYDEKHASTVAKLSLEIFDVLTRDYGMDRRSRMLLEVAALLHDIGTIIRFSGHHKHGEYIVANSEIFGLNRRDLSIISNVVRYHRKMGPAPNHYNYIALQREDRLMVTKLAAILRVADALDRRHDSKTGILAFERAEDRFIIKPEKKADYSLERMSLAEKGDLFGEIFGLEPVLA